MPLYCWVNWLPLNSRTTLKDTLSPSMVPLEISTAPPRPPSIEPVSLLPEAWSVRVWVCVLPPLPWNWAVHLPSTSAANASEETPAKMPSSGTDF